MVGICTSICSLSVFSWIFVTFVTWSMVSTPSKTSDVTEMVGLVSWLGLLFGPWLDLFPIVKGIHTSWNQGLKTSDVIEMVGVLILELILGLVWWLVYSRRYTYCSNFDLTFAAWSVTPFVVVTLTLVEYRRSFFSRRDLLSYLKRPKTSDMNDMKGVPI